MAKLMRWISVMCFGAALLLAGAVPSDAQPKIVRAKIGILVISGDQSARAKGKDRLKAGDKLRVYVQPEESSWVYVVHADEKNVTLLKMVEGQVPASLLTLPSAGEFYQVDGGSPAETITVLCSPEELKDISALAKTPVTVEKWRSMEKELSRRGEIDLGQKSEKPFPIAGNVRGEKSVRETEIDSFLYQLQIFSGNAVLVKQYEFSVKK